MPKQINDNLSYFLFWELRVDTVLDGIDFLDNLFEQMINRQIVFGVSFVVGKHFSEQVTKRDQKQEKVAVACLALVDQIYCAEVQLHQHQKLCIWQTFEFCLVN